MAKVPLPLKYHGGKNYLSKKIVALMPEHLHYCEPFFGGGAVLLAKDSEGVSEVVNDLNEDLTNFWMVLQRPAGFYTFQRIVEVTPFSEIEWKEADLDSDQCPSDVERAVAFFIRCRQSLAGRMKAFTSITKTRVRRGMNNEVSAWLSAIEGLPLVHNRLRRVLILNRKAVDVIRQQDGPDTLLYCDPPYLSSTRASPDVYTHEMTKKDHKELLRTLGKIKGKFLLSGYRSKLYDNCATKYGWSRVDMSVPNHAAGGKDKRRMCESIWANYELE